MYHIEVVQANGESQSAQQDGAEEETVLICRVVWSNVVKVEDPDTKDSEVGTDAHIGHNYNGQHL